MVVGDEGAGWSRSVSGFVVPDDRGESEESLQDASDYPNAPMLSNPV